MSNRVTHFEIHATDPQRAMAFYKAVFGWDFPKWMDSPAYWGVIIASKGDPTGCKRAAVQHTPVPNGAL